MKVKRSSQRVLVLSIGRQQQGLRIDRYLAEIKEIGSRSFAQNLIENDRVKLDAHPVKKSDRLVEGSVLKVELPEVFDMQTNNRSMPYKIAYSDEYLVVIDKPAGVVVHPAPSHKGATTLVEAMSESASKSGSEVKPRLVHRLDRDTSGLLIVAWDLETQRALQLMIRRREISRNYIALVEGALDARSGTIDAPLGRDRSDRTVMSTDTQKPRSARTHFKVVEFLSQTTLVKVRLETGRTHQVRAHFAAIGHPLVGDPTYGKKGLLGLDRQFLHSCRISFKHPITQVEIDVESKLPGDLEKALDKARTGR